MPDDLVGLLVGLAFTVLPVSVSTVWGVRRRRRLAREQYVVRLDFRPFAEAFAALGAVFAELGENLSAFFATFEDAMWWEDKGRRYPRPVLDEALRLLKSYGLTREQALDLALRQAAERAHA